MERMHGSLSAGGRDDEWQKMTHVGKVTPQTPYSQQDLNSHNAKSKADPENPPKRKPADNDGLPANTDEWEYYYEDLPKCFGKEYYPICGVPHVFMAAFLVFLLLLSMAFTFFSAVYLPFYLKDAEDSSDYDSDLSTLPPNITATQ